MNLYLKCGLTGATLLGTCAYAQEKVKNALPNVIFLVADDLGYGDLSCYGMDRIQTPHVDGLSSNGILFYQCPFRSGHEYPFALFCLPVNYSWRREDTGCLRVMP